jgi:glycosyltransferase involved in cell wall biosynthesis
VTVVHEVVAGEDGGAERMLVDLAAQEGHAIALVTPSDALRTLFRGAKLDVVDRGPAREGPLTYLARSLGRADVAWLEGILRERRARIAHLHTFASQVVGTRAAIRAGAKVLRTEHSTRVYDDPSCWPFSRWSLVRSDAVVCISEHVKRVALARAPFIESKVRVVPNGVDLDRFAVAPFPAPAARTRFVSVGRLDRRKGIDIALAAIAAVERAELDVVGDGEERDALERRARDLGVASRVRFLGWQEDPRPAIAAADAALSSARTEGLGVALLEAMAMGRPVVALPTGGVPEIVRDGESGWLAHGSDAGALTRVIAEAVERPDERRRRGERARAGVLARFSIAAMRAGYERAYAALHG